MYMVSAIMTEHPFEPTPWYAIELFVGVASIAFALVFGFFGLMFVPDLRGRERPSTDG